MISCFHNFFVCFFWDSCILWNVWIDADLTYKPLFGICQKDIFKVRLILFFFALKFEACFLDISLGQAKSRQNHEVKCQNPYLSREWIKSCMQCNIMKIIIPKPSVIQLLFRLLPFPFSTYTDMFFYLGVSDVCICRQIQSSLWLE